MTGPGEVVAFRWKRGPIGFSAAMLGLASVAGLLIASEGGPARTLQGLAWTAFFAWAAWRVARRLKDQEPVVTISQEGLRDRRIREAVIPWSAISAIEPFEAESTPFIGIEFHDPGAIMPTARPMMRYAAPLQRLMRFPTTSMQMSLLDGSGEDVLAAIDRFAPGKVMRG